MTLFSIKELVATNRLLEMLVDEVRKSEFFEESLYQKMTTYTEEFLTKEGQGQIAPDRAYFNFIRAYNKDMKEFAKTGKYPLEIDQERPMLDRYAYNVVLLFSCLFSAHRFRIMQLIDQKSEQIENGLFIGCGPGLEIELVKSKMKNLYAYDLTMDDFLFEKHPKVIFKQEYFDGKNDDIKYDSVYLIEILEHLSNPDELLTICRNALTESGKIYLTTATNIPQFDHLYNFEPDHIEFENGLKENGFNIELMEDIPHHSVTMNVGAKNRFYIISKQKV